MQKICPACHQELPVDSFYYRRTEGRPSVYCKPCTNKQAMDRQQKLKQQAIAYKGAKCQHCGYERYAGSLEFHHLDPSRKDFSLGHARSTTFAHIQDELDKCILLCANCHREAHARLKGLI